MDAEGESGEDADAEGAAADPHQRGDDAVDECERPLNDEVRQLLTRVLEIERLMATRTPTTPKVPVSTSRCIHLQHRDRAFGTGGGSVLGISWLGRLRSRPLVVVVNSGHSLAA
jgi:hypothetical protein